MRFYITQTIGDGLSEATAFRSRCALYTDSTTYNCDMRIDDKLPGLMLAECNPTVIEHVGMLADPLIQYLAIHKPLDAMILSEDTLSELASWNALKIQLHAYGVPTNALSPSSTVRDLAQTMVRRFTLRFELRENDFPIDLVAGLTGERAQIIRGRLAPIGFTPSNQTDVSSALQEYMTQGAYKMQTRHD